MITRLVPALAVVLAALSTTPLEADDALPGVGGPFTLIDQHGDTRTEADPAGRAQLLFFGYVNCQEICSAALPLMADVSDILAKQGHEVAPVLVTVDPIRDTVDTMAEPLAALHPDFVGLTGAEDALQRAYDAYSIEFEELFIDPEYGPVFSHGSYIYLLDADGQVLTQLPPILPPDHMAAIVEANLTNAG